MLRIAACRSCFAALFPLSFFLASAMLADSGEASLAFWQPCALSVQLVEGTIVCECIWLASAQGALQAMSLATHSSSSARPVLLLGPAAT